MKRKNASKHSKMSNIWFSVKETFIRSDSIQSSGRASIQKINSRIHSLLAEIFTDRLILQIALWYHTGGLCNPVDRLRWALEFEIPSGGSTSAIDWEPAGLVTGWVHYSDVFIGERVTGSC